MVVQTTRPGELASSWSSGTRTSWVGCLAHRLDLLIKASAAAVAAHVIDPAGLSSSSSRKTTNQATLQRTQPSSFAAQTPVFTAITTPRERPVKVKEALVLTVWDPEWGCSRSGCPSSGGQSEAHDTPSSALRKAGACGPTLWCLVNRRSISMLRMADKRRAQARCTTSCHRRKSTSRQLT
jgi:hypothetical protein